MSPRSPFGCRPCERALIGPAAKPGRSRRWGPWGLAMIDYTPRVIEPGP